MSLLWLLLVPFVGSAVAAVLPTNARNLESLWAALVMLAVAVPLGLLFPAVEAGQVLTERLVWLPSLGLDMVVRLDGFAWMFAMLVSGMGLLVVVYARYYLSPEDPAARFYSLLLGFVGAMLGVVVSGNLPSADGKYSLYCAVIVKRVDERARAKTSINELLRD